jgi:hypothetical protein
MPLGSVLGCGIWSSLIEEQLYYTRVDQSEELLRWAGLALTVEEWLGDEEEATPHETPARPARPKQARVTA